MELDSKVIVNMIIMKQTHGLYVKHILKAEAIRLVEDPI